MVPRRASLKTLVATFLLLPGAGLSGACAAGAGGTGGGGSNPDLITREEIDQNDSYATAYELVQRLRPRWLRVARAPVGGPASPTAAQAAEPVVLLDGVRFGELASLRNVSLSNVQSMRYLDARDATTLYGTGYQGGAIQVTTARGR